MDSSQLSELEWLCRESVSAGIKILCETGVWPRPPTARRIRPGDDFPPNIFHKISEVAALVDLLASASKIQELYFHQSWGPDSWQLYDYWMRLLLRALYETEGELISTSIFRKWFKKFLRELFSDTASWRSIDTVSGLNLCGRQLKLAQGTVLLSVPGGNLRSALLGQEQYFTHGWLAGGLDKATLITTAIIKKRDYAGLKRPPPDLFNADMRHSAVIKAVRLIKSGVPRLHYHAEAHLSSFPLEDAITYCNWEGDLEVYEKEAVLERGDFHLVRNLWREIMKTQYEGHKGTPTSLNMDRIDTALSRFCSTYDRKSAWMDRITDLTIVLESLFGQGVGDELRHRISLRAAWLMSSEQELNQDRGKITNTMYRAIRTMYDIRSCRVHGRIPRRTELIKWIETLSGAKYNPLQRGEAENLALEAARGIVRKAIVVCMTLSKLSPKGPCWPLPKDFDEEIVIPGQRRAWQKASGIVKSK